MDVEKLFGVYGGVIWAFECGVDPHAEQPTDSENKETFFASEVSIDLPIKTGLESAKPFYTGQ